MTEYAAIVAASGLPLAGWSLHVVLLLRRLQTARRDPVTALWTRQAWTARAHRVLARSTAAAVLLIDLDDFKTVNDDHGHAAGDAVLAATAERLAVLADRGAVVGRLGGDEFAVAAPQLDSRTLLDLRERLARPVRHAGRWLPVSASIGVCRLATLPEPQRGLTGALGAADADMYEVKGSDRRGRRRAARATAGGVRA